MMSLQCVRGAPRSGRSSEELSPTPYTMGSDGEGDVTSPLGRYSTTAGPGRAVGPIASPIARYGRTLSRCDLLPEFGEDDPSSGLPARPRSGMFKYAGPEDYSVMGGRGRDDYSPNGGGGRDDCCQGRDEQFQLSSSSDKDDSAYHEPLYYNCGSSPARQDEAGTSGFYQVHEKGLYEVGSYSTLPAWC